MNMINTIIIIVAAMVIIGCLSHIGYTYAVAIVSAIMNYEQIYLDVSGSSWLLTIAVGVLVAACLF